MLVLAACATPQGPGSPGGGDEWPGERKFIATTVTENGAAKPIVEGTRITVTFGANGRVNADAGCNYMRGTGRIDSGRLVVDNLAMTEMGCPGDRMDQDAWVADFLTSRPTLSLDGDELTLATATITMLLLDREAADPNRPLVATPWTVTTIYQGDSVSTAIHPVPAVLLIGPSSGSETSIPFTAGTGCISGRLRGTVSISGQQLTFTVTADEPCVGGSNAIDEAVRATLTGEVTYEIEADQLRLLRPDGSGIGLEEGSTGYEGHFDVDCGTVTLVQSRTPGAGSLACFLDAVAAGQSVHLTIVRPTVEGDPIATTYRADRSGSIEVITDSRQDRFGSGQVEYQVCEEPSVGEDGFLTFVRCSEAVPV